MTLHRKIVVLLFAGITLYTVVGFLFNQFLILPRFEELEREEAEKNMRRCLESLESQIDTIDLLCFDWAAWDATYDFVLDRNEEYESSNLVPDYFSDSVVNFMYFVRVDGTLVWGRYYDLKLKMSVPLRELEAQTWPRDHPLLNHAGRGTTVKGIVSTLQGPLLIASRPILPSVETAGEVVRGTLLMGRTLDESIVETIRKHTQVSVDVLDIRRDPLPQGSTALRTGEIRVLEESPEVLRVLSHLHDIEGEDALLLHLAIPRTILARGKTAIHLNGIAAAIAGFVFLLMLLFSLKWVITDPLERLSAQVKQVTLAEAMLPAGVPHRGDEIGELTREFHNMLNRLREEEADLVAAEAALRASETRLKTILSTAPDAIFTLKADGRIASANGAAAILFDYALPDFRDMPSTQLFAEDSRAAWAALLAQHGTTSPESVYFADGESCGRRRDGTRFPIHLSVSSVELEGEQHFICDIRDISGLKAMQEKVARNQHLATIGEMGASVAHEIRNPLAGIKGALQILSSGTLARAEALEITSAIDDLVDRIAHTVEQLLGYAKPIVPRSEVVDVRALIESVSAPLPNGARLAINCEAGLTLDADQRLFQRVLENIWRNACQWLDGGGQLLWDARRDGDFALIALQNDGPPISEAALGHVFDPFFTTRVDGSGLGLSVSLRIVEAHGGTMRVANIGERGVLVEVRMPLGA